MTKLPYRQAMLMKHTAWMNTRLIERGPRPEDEPVRAARGADADAGRMSELRDARP